MGIPQVSSHTGQAKTNLGLINRDYDTKVNADSRLQETQWQRFKAFVDRLNQDAEPETQYKLLYMGRHGEGDHNVAEAFYGRKDWDVRLLNLTIMLSADSPDEVSLVQT